MPTERIGYAVGALNGLLYVVGGYPLSGSYEPLGMAEVYDPTSDTWSKRHSLTVPRKYAALVASQGRLYVVGGATESPSANTPIAAVEEYDPLTDMWATKAPMPTPRKLLGAAEWDGRLYAIGGQTPSDTTSSVAEFDLQSNAWSERQSLAKERYALATVAFDGSLYVVGGLDSLSRPLRDVEAGTIIGSRIYIPYITLE